MVIHVRPEVGQSYSQRTLDGDVTFVGSERLNKSGVDVVVGTSEEALLSDHMSQCLGSGESVNRWLTSE